MEKGIFIIVRVIRHREIRGDDKTIRRRRRRASTRNHSAGCHDYRSQRVTQIEICQKVMDNETKKENEQKDSRRNETDYETVA